MKMKVMLFLALGMLGAGCGVQKAPASLGGCGDGFISASEMCDGTQFGSLSCASFGYPGGFLTCADDCNSYSYASCSNEEGPATQSAPESGESTSSGPTDDGTPDFDDDPNSDLSQPAVPVSNGLEPGSACWCDADCGSPVGHESLCVEGVCMYRASDSCSDSGSSVECASGSRCWAFEESGETSICWPDCDAYICAGTCDADGSCAPSEENSCGQICGEFCQEEGCAAPGADCSADGASDGSADDGCGVSSDDSGDNGGDVSCDTTSDDSAPDASCDAASGDSTCDSTCDPSSSDSSCDSTTCDSTTCDSTTCDSATSDSTTCDPSSSDDGDDDWLVDDTEPAPNENIGGACVEDTDCLDPGAICLREGYPGGYCTVIECEERGCPAEIGCYGGAVEGESLCLGSCETVADCRIGYACMEEGVCYPNGEGGTGAPRCTAESCGEGEFCGSAGTCLPVDAGLPTGVVPDCGAAGPNWLGCQWDGEENRCDELIFFNPRSGEGYWDYPLNGETEGNQYRSWLRRDLVLLIQHASAQTACLSAGWGTGNGQPLGLGDMSEADGAIPGTAEGDVGHPEGSHTNGFDIDIAYYQTGTPDNTLRSICKHIVNGVDQYHCVDEPETLDLWRTALFLGLLHRNDNLRVIGVDGRVGRKVEAAFEQLCAAGWLTGPVCEPQASKVAYEETDDGEGWFLFHHHHFHVSLSEPEPWTWARFPRISSRCLSMNCERDTVLRQLSLERWLPALIRLR